MVIYDQLRISDDGQSLFIDAHVNKAAYFDKVYLKKITICTEDQVSETSPLDYGDDFIYQEDFVPTDTLVPINHKVIELSEKQLLKTLTPQGGIQLRYDPLDDAINNALSLVFSGKYTVLDTGFIPKLVVTTRAFNPETDHLNNPEILFTVDGTPFEDKGHRVWQFKGKGEVKKNQPVYIYLFKQTAEGEYVYVDINETDDIEFLHFFYQAYSLVAGENKKEVHLVLNKNSFNEKFKACDLSHNMFFVYIECAGTPDPCTPCRLDEPNTLGVTFDYGIFFNRAMNYTRELADKCVIPGNFLDFILNAEALKLAIETEHYIPAIWYWKNLMGMSDKGTHGTFKPCGCHG